MTPMLDSQAGQATLPIPAMDDWETQSIAVDKDGYECKAVVRRQAAQDIFTVSGIGMDAWVGPTLARLDRVAGLADNWDGEGSSATDPALVQVAIRFLDRVRNVFTAPLPAPDVCPIPGGGFQLEWDCGHRCLELEFIDRDTLGFLSSEVYPNNDEVITSGEYPARVFRKTLELLSWLVSA
jgi:hypothetical protein